MFVKKINCYSYNKEGRIAKFCSKISKNKENYTFKRFKYNKPKIEYLEKKFPNVIGENLKERLNSLQ